MWLTKAYKKFISEDKPHRLGMTPIGARNRLFKHYVKFHYFLMVFSLFWDTESIISILPSEGPIGAHGP